MDLWHYEKWIWNTFHGRIKCIYRAVKVVYEKITYEKGGSRYFSSKYNKKLIEANIRKAFCDKTDFNTTEELIPEEANLLNIANFTSEVYADNLDNYYPRQNAVENIMLMIRGN